ncbi:MAG: hypothetical protein LBU41_01530, partial [Clostridiales Family XIII bacterium]|nr:hypothetical protein [Clostridiales Family XIII bacterium]
MLEIAHAKGEILLPFSENVQYNENMENEFGFALAGGDIHEERGRVFRHVPFVMEQKLIDCVASGDEEGSLAVLAQIERRGAKAKLSEEPLRSAKNSVICTITILARAAIRAGVDADEAFAESDFLIREVETLRASKEVLSFEGDALMRFVGLVNSRALSHYSFPVGRATHYIEVHLSEKITLADVAKYAQV